MNYWKGKKAKRLDKEPLTLSCPVQSTQNYGLRELQENLYVRKWVSGRMSDHIKAGSKVFWFPHQHKFSLIFTFSKRNMSKIDVTKTDLSHSNISYYWEFVFPPFYKRLSFCSLHTSIVVSTSYFCLLEIKGCVFYRHMYISSKAFVPSSVLFSKHFTPKL